MALLQISTANAGDDGKLLHLKSIGVLAFYQEFTIIIQKYFFSWPCGGLSDLYKRSHYQLKLF